MIVSIFHFIWMQVNEVKTNLSQIGFDVEMIHQMVSGLVSWYIFFNMFFYVTQKCFKLIGVLMLYLLIGSTGREGRLYWEQTGYISGYATTLEIFYFLFVFVVIDLTLLFSIQDATNSGLLYLCQVADGVKGQLDTKPLQVRIFSFCSLENWLLNELGDISS